MSDKTCGGGSLHRVDGRAERTETVKEERWWEVNFEGRLLKTDKEQEALTFCAELTRYDRAHELRQVVAVTRTETVKRRVIGSSIENKISYRRSAAWLLPAGSAGLKQET